MKKPTFHLRSLSATLLILLFSGHPVLADDTEVLIGAGGPALTKPNILFIMDTSGSMSRNVDGRRATNNDPSRLSIVQGVFEDLMNDNSGINVGLMRFDDKANGGYFVSPMQELNSTTRSGIIAASDNFTAKGGTPLAETLYEAALFYSGSNVDYGDSSRPGTNHRDVFTGNHYDSPISSECQANYVVLLTDGVPSKDTGADSKISRDFLGNASCNGNCLDEVAGYLHTVDQSPNGNSIPGNQTVETYTIGFTTNQALLQDTATAGGGEYITANNAAELSAAFTSILNTITDTNDSFSPPALAVNSFSGVSHYNKLYFALFEPAAAPKWKGNVKPYALNDNYQLVDADNQVAVDARGFFLESSRSFWSNTDDGGSIAAGGANGQLPSTTSRNLYTYTGDYSDNLVLSHSSNALDDTNTDITRTLLDLPVGLSNADAAIERTRILNAVRADRSLGAPLHSQPTLVTYGGTEAAPDLTVFVATNDGFLHALNASSGIEQFAFIPQELLPNLDTLTGTTGDHPYGLDGDITTWVKENNASNDTDHTIESSEGDHVYVYVGMRRGGKNYYALDVTNRDAPELKWAIKGGIAGTDFAELGQSWSKPTLTSIKYGSDTKKVLIFGGGYDTLQDTNPVDTNDTTGRAIFIIDAEDGTLLWSASPSGSNSDDHLVMTTLTNSIPSDVRLFDSNLDGHTDRLYVGDMRGQIFRFDLTATTDAMNGTGVRLASLGGSDEANNRRFFYPPDLVVTRNQGTYISLNIGSGYRAHPLNPVNNNGTPGARVNDRFYSLRDPYIVTAVPDDYTSLANGNLFDATSSLVTSDADITSLSNSNGWYITLGNGNGEKVLAPSLTINGTISFTTYTPPGSESSTSCEPPAGVGRVYHVSLFNAAPVSHVNDNAADPNAPAPTIDDRHSVLERPGIPPSPVIVFTEDGMEECIGTACGPPGGVIQIRKAYWTDGS